MRVVKALLWAMAWLAAAIISLLVVFYLILLAVNWNDQAPSEAVLRLEASYESRPFIDDQDNAYVYLMGFSSGKTEDPREWGMRRIAWAQKLISQSQEDVGSDPFGEDYDFKSERSAVVSALSEACKHMDHDCLVALESGEGTIYEWLVTEGWLFDRYRVLLSHPGWFEPIPYHVDVPLPAYSDVLEGQKLLFAQAWVLAGQGDATRVRELLGEDLRFWRQGLNTSDTLISKMIAAAALKRNFEWSNFILRQLPADRVMQGIPQPWMKPFSQSERSLQRCLTGEWVSMDRMIKKVKDREPYSLFDAANLNEESALSRLLSRMVQPMIQSQDISNRYAELLEAIVKILDVPYEEYAEALDRTETLESQASEVSMPPTRMYNIVGNILFAIATPDYTTYAARVADLEGIRQAALLSATLRSQNIAPDLVGQHLYEAQFRNPYNGEPFHWNECDGAIVFIGLEPGERGRHSFFY